jgi:hypothetical protein
MRRKPVNRIAMLAASVTVIAASAPVLSEGMGAHRSYLLAGVAIGCGAILIYVAVMFHRHRNSPS